MNMKKIFAAAIILSLSFALNAVYAYCENLKLDSVKLVNKPVFISIPAEVISKDRVSISSKITGYIRNLNVDIGDMVRKGDILLVIEKSATAQNIKQAQANVERAKAQLENAEFNYRKFLSLYKQKVISKKKFMDIKTDYEASKGAYEQARAGFKIAESLLGYSVVRSPVNGIISKKYVYNGDMAVVSQPLLEINSLNHLQVRAYVSSDILSKINKTKKINVKIKDRLVNLDVKYISLVSDPVSRTFEIKANLPAKIAANPGEFASLLIKIKTSPTIIINKRDLTKRGYIEGVFSVDKKGKAHFRIIRLGKSYKNEVEVLSGLYPGQKVVANPPLYLKNGMQINNEKK